MDERKKTIKELELLRTETLRQRSRLLENLGESLLGRAGQGGGTESGPLGRFAGEYRRLCKEVQDAGEAVKAIEGDKRRLKQIGETLVLKKDELSIGRQNRDRLYSLLGERIMDGTAPGESEPFKRQLDALEDKVRALEDQVKNLEGQDPSNLFSRLSKNAKGRFYHASLEKYQTEIRRIHETLGKQFASLKDRKVEEEEPAAKLLEGIGAAQEQMEALEGEIARLQEEQQRIALNLQGGAERRIGALEKQAGRVKKEIRSLFEECGEAVAADAADRAGEFERFLEEEDRALLQKIGEARETLGDLESRIEKLKASLAIDEERFAIAKMEKALEGHRSRITEGEAAIQDLEERIRKSQQHIEELQNIEAYGVKN